MLVQYLYTFNQTMVKNSNLPYDKTCFKLNHKNATIFFKIK